jgi:hypothetical protein
VNDNDPTIARKGRTGRYRPPAMTVVQPSSCRGPDAVIPGRELQLAGPESITHVPAKAGNRFRVMDSGLAARAAPRNDSLGRNDRITTSPLYAR